MRNNRQLPVICLSIHVKTCSFLRTLLQVTSPGSTCTTRRQNSNHHSGRVPRLRDQRRGTRCKAKQRSYYWRFLILRVLYTMSMLPTGKQFYVEVLRCLCESGPCTTTMRPHTLHILCSSFWPNMAPLSCSNCHTHQISHRVTFSFSQGLRKF